MSMCWLIRVCVSFDAVCIHIIAIVAIIIVDLAGIANSLSAYIRELKYQ